MRHWTYNMFVITLFSILGQWSTSTRTVFETIANEFFMDGQAKSVQNNQIHTLIRAGSWTYRRRAVKTKEIMIFNTDFMNAWPAIFYDTWVINNLVVRGATSRYLTLNFILKSIYFRNVLLLVLPGPKIHVWRRSICMNRYKYKHAVRLMQTKPKLTGA